MEGQFYDHRSWSLYPFKSVLLDCIDLGHPKGVMGIEFPFIYISIDPLVAYTLV